MKIKKNDIVTNNSPVTQYNTVVPAGTKFRVWKATRAGTLFANIIDTTNYSPTTILDANDVTKVDAPKPTVNIGDVFAADWGYEQTQTSWFKVKRIMNKSVELVSLGERRQYTGPMCGNATVDVNNESQETFIRRIQIAYNGEPCFKYTSYATAFKVDPSEPRFFSEWH